MSPAELALVWVWIRDALERAGHPELEQRIRVTFDRRRTRSLASMHLDAELRVSLKPWSVLPESEREDTIRHEVAHLVAFVRHGKDAWNHGPLWKRAAVQCGARPLAALRSSELARKVAGMRRVKRVVAACRCSSAPEFAVAGLARLRTGEHLLRPKAARAASFGFARCRQCDARLEVKGFTYVGGETPEQESSIPPRRRRRPA